MPERASNEARAEPVAPHPTMTTRDWDSFFCPSAPISLNNTCREYRSSISKAITSAITFIRLSNQYYRCAVVKLCFCEQRVPPCPSSNPESFAVTQPEFREGLLRLSGAAWIVLVLVLILALAHRASWAQSPAPAPQPPAESPSKSKAQSEGKCEGKSEANSGAKSATNFGTITPYLGL